MNYNDNIALGVAKIKEGFELVEAEIKKLKDSTVGAVRACEYYGISRPTLIKRRKENMVPYILFGKEYRYFINKI
jgi:hypothetical protein